MNLEKFEVNETGVLELRDAADAPMLGDDGAPMMITLYSPGSKKYAKAKAAQQNRMIDKLKRKGRVDQTAEERASDTLELLVACTKEFSANMQVDGLTDGDLFRAVYSNTKLGFITEQAEKFVGDWANFLPPSTKTSVSTSDKAPG